MSSPWRGGPAWLVVTTRWPGAKLWDAVAVKSCGAGAGAAALPDLHLTSFVRSVTAVLLYTFTPAGRGASAAL